MNEFIVGPDGLLREKRPQDAAAWYGEHAHASDLLGIEAHFILIRAGTAAIEAGRPDRMSLARYNVLRFLYMAEGYRRSMTEIAQRLDVTLTNVTKLIDALVQADLVQRIEDTEDKRKTWAELKPGGVTLFESVFMKVATQVEAAWSGFNDREKRVLIHLLAKFRMQYETANPEESFMKELVGLPGSTDELSVPED